MNYSILIYGEDSAFDRLPEAEQQSVMRGHHALQEALAKRGLFATAKLMPSTSAVTINTIAEPGQDALVTDGPFAETKERFLGFYSAQFKDLEEAIHYASYLASPYARIEVRPIGWAGGVLAPEN